MSGWELPWQQVVDALDGVVGDASEDLFEIELRVESIQLGGAEQRVDGSGAFAARVRSGEERVFAAKGHDTQGALGGIVVDLEVAILCIASESAPAREGVADRRSGIGLAGEHAELRLHPGAQVCERWLCSGLADGEPHLRQAAAHLAFDRIELTDALQSFGCCRQSGQNFDSSGANVRSYWCRS